MSYGAVKVSAGPKMGPFASWWEKHRVLLVGVIATTVVVFQIGVVTTKQRLAQASSSTDLAVEAEDCEGLELWAMANRSPQACGAAATRLCGACDEACLWSAAADLSGTCGRLHGVPADRRGATTATFCGACSKPEGLDETCAAVLAHYGDRNASVFGFFDDLPERWC
eukprot:CAMPEP_0197422604 /NCGR_PEP_ID=MMETSP1170-20131217/17024_1 /TAXON_ID=54406 /ORGANISM="Sarcinochrysis sp, Strain CCMP770" /LENGTH=167 /DNA_ID=CAMNT_0042949951 /DNA_START=44 /DNA_END=547 /DNA_ORIENTATION=-